MAQPVVDVRAVGTEGQPLVVIDGFAPDPDALRAAATAARFGPAGHHYPGLRAPLPPDYFDWATPVIAAALKRGFGIRAPADVIDASFSIVTTRPRALSVRQRMPHCDAFGAERIALIHYLSPGGDGGGGGVGGSGGGTAFYRHRSTGYETIDEARAPGYFEALDAELRDGGAPPTAYIAGDTALFERTAIADARYNRALLYRSFVLHSGAIAPDAALSPDPAVGRLTVTAFLTVP